MLLHHTRTRTYCRAPLLQLCIRQVLQQQPPLLVQQAMPGGCGGVATTQCWCQRAAGGACKRLPPWHLHATPTHRLLKGSCCR